MCTFNVKSKCIIGISLHLCRDPLLQELISTVRNRLDQMEDEDSSDQSDSETSSDEGDETNQGGILSDDDSDDADDEEDYESDNDSENSSDEVIDEEAAETSDSGICLSE